MALLQTSHRVASHLSGCLPALSSQVVFVRSYRPEVLRRGIEKNKQSKKQLYRVIEETHGLEPALELPEREELPKRHPKYTNRVSLGPDNPHYHQQVAYIYNHDVQLQEGIKQALWLTKSTLMGDGKMPTQVQDLADSLDIPDMEQRVEQSVKQCRLYDTNDRLLPMERYSFTQTMALIRLCGLLGTRYPEILSRAQATNYYTAASWTRENDIIQVRGRPGVLLTSKKPLPVLASPEEVEETSRLVLESFYPIAPTIDLRHGNIYKHNHNFPGFLEGYPFPHAHTLFICQKYLKYTEKFNAMGIMFAFANALSRAKLQYGVEETDLPSPIVTQCVVTNGVQFSYIHVQLNTLRLDSSEGPKNMVWLDQDNPLYLDMYPPKLKIRRIKGNLKTDRRFSRPLLRRDPKLGCQELDVAVFRKFLGCFMNGAVAAN